MNSDSRIQELPLMEAFYSIQGEGFHAGRAAYFIRLGGCDVGCHWCDVKESWEAEKWPEIHVEEIAAGAAASGSDMVVVTGGEPLMHDLGALTKSLKNHGLQTHLETSGAHPLTGEWDWICLSPKKFKKPTDDIFHRADELKVIVYNKSDLAWGEQMAARVGDDCKLYFQPEWSRSEAVMPLIIEYVKDNPRWEISLQIHKFMNIP